MLQHQFKYKINTLFKSKQYLIYHRFKMDATKNWGDRVQMGDIQLKNRICMAALTRTRCDPKDGVPTDLVVEYYSQRAGCGLLLTQASAWSPRGHAFPGAANFYNKQHYQGWKRVVEAVHQKGGKLFIQLFHCGRSTDYNINGGLQIWAPSAIGIRTPKWPSTTDLYPVPKEMTIQNIKQTQQQFRKAVKAAKEVGFDGVQLHGAHGYIVDQFIRSESNKRTDEYGGSAEKRSRFCLQLLDICLEHFQPYQVGLKVSPVSQYGDMYDKDPVETYSYLLKQVNKRKIGFVELRESTEYGIDKKGSGSKVYYEKTPPEQIENVCKTFRPFYEGVIIANDSFTPERGLQYIRNGWADMVSFGRLYISNPDLAERILRNQNLNEKWDFYTFFSPLNPKGYTDYPFYEQWRKEQDSQKLQTKL